MKKNTKNRSLKSREDVAANRHYVSRQLMAAGYLGVVAVLGFFLKFVFERMGMKAYTTYSVYDILVISGAGLVALTLIFYLALRLEARAVGITDEIEPERSK